MSIRRRLSLIGEFGDKCIVSAKHVPDSSTHYTAFDDKMSYYDEFSFAHRFLTKQKTNGWKQTCMLFDKQK